ncbi:helix-turn-helix domain-containing protein [Confluentibacter sediminis]|uniref:helix-turn-helix domain-containing protein n=1 Tax=Confluentibacter sediminis TaxID=2219045 RepID=UPI000DAD960D|nr:helix-turn-helix domain-containing protein [Confluentibacter sediminis]
MYPQPSIKSLTIDDLVGIIGDIPQEENGLHVHLSKNKFKEIPIGYPFRGNSYAFLLVVKGSLKIQLNLLRYTIKNSEIIVVNPQTVTHIQEMSNNLEIAIINFNVDFVLRDAIGKNDIDTLDIFTANSIPKLKLSKDDLKMFISVSKILERNNRFGKNTPYNGEIITHCFNLLVYHYASLLKIEFPDLEANLTRQERLALRFLKLLNENFKRERTVQFYADILCLTPGYLSKVLKTISKKTAGQLIDEAVIMEAKLLLKNQTLSVSEVANELQFSDQSFFGKYFKKHTGYSPSEFRKIKFKKLILDQ